MTEAAGIIAAAGIPATVEQPAQRYEARKLDPLDPDAAPYSPNTAKVIRLYLAQRFAPRRVGTQLPNNLADVLPFIQCRSAGAGSDGAVPTLTDDMLDVDVYAPDEEAAFLLAGQIRYDLQLNAPGVTLDRSTIRRVLTVAAPGVRPYINTGLVRVGATYAASLHTRSR